MDSIIDEVLWTPLRLIDPISLTIIDTPVRLQTSPYLYDKKSLLDYLSHTPRQNWVDPTNRKQIVLHGQPQQTLRQDTKVKQVINELIQQVGSIGRDPDTDLEHKVAQLIILRRKFMPLLQS